MPDLVTVPVEEVPEGGCVAAGDGRVLLTRIDGEIRAFENRCLHKGTRLDGGSVRGGILTCPAHFWRYRLEDGANVNSGRTLPRYDVEVVDDHVVVELPEQPATSLRDQLLEHARTWSRDD